MAKAPTKRKPRTKANGDGTIYEYPKGRWVGMIHVDGRRVKRTGRTKTEVTTKLNELKRMRDDGIGPGYGNKTVGMVIDEWWERFKAGKEAVGEKGKKWSQLAPSTQDRYRWAVDILGKEFGATRITALTSDRVEEGLERIASGAYGRRLARSTVVRVRAVLVEVLRYAKRKKWTPTNVAMDARVGDVGHAARERIALTPDEAGKLWVGCEGEWFGAMFRTMIATGVRPGEAAGMHDDDVDLDGAVIEVRHGRSRDASGRSVPVDSLKTDHSHRFVELSPGTVEMLRKHRAAMAAERLAAGGSWPDQPRLMFPARDGRVARSEVVSAELAAICQRVKVPVVRPNELRHTAASLAVDAGIPLDQVSDQLGHKDMRMVTQTYRHKVRPTVGAGSAAIVDRLFSTAGQ